MDNVWIEIWWLGALVWTIAYTSDALLTNIGARLYRTHAREHLVFEGSYEITREYQQDVDALRIFTARFAFDLVLYVTLLLICWSLSTGSDAPELYLFVLGSFILPQVPIHVRHVVNIATFRLMSRKPGVTGRLEYPRWILLRLSSIEIALWGVVFLWCAVPMRSALAGGGSLGCFALAARQFRRSRKTT